MGNVGFRQEIKFWLYLLLHYFVYSDVFDIFPFMDFQFDSTTYFQQMASTKPV